MVLESIEVGGRICVLKLSIIALPGVHPPKRIFLRIPTVLQAVLLCISHDIHLSYFLLILPPIL